MLCKLKIIRITIVYTMKKMQYCDIIKDLRKMSKTPREAIAEVCGVNVSTYTRWESGEAKMPLEAAVRLSNYYNVSLDSIVGHNKVENRSDNLGLSSYLDVLLRNSDLIEKMIQIPKGHVYWEKLDTLVDAALEQLEETSLERKEA
jgi:transcriptional regulator with XRE-family HTH domain